MIDECVTGDCAVGIFCYAFIGIRAHLSSSYGSSASKLPIISKDNLRSVFQILRHKYLSPRITTLAIITSLAPKKLIGKSEVGNYQSLSQTRTKLHLNQIPPKNSSRPIHNATCIFVHSNSVSPPKQPDDFHVNRDEDWSMST